MITCKEDITIRRMKDEDQDYELLTKWLRDEKVLEFYQGRDKPSTIDEILEKYQPRVKGESSVIPCFIQYKGESIGYIQYYTIDDEEYEEYSYTKDELIYGIDLFIGETNYQNRGIGTRVIKGLVNFIKITIKPDRIVIDPRVDNVRAISCYEKCGFKTNKILKKHELHEGKYCDNLLMDIECGEK